jgi:hypothetical protein
MSKKTNLIVGSEVLIDWPMKWKDTYERFRDQARADAEKSPHFGETGVVVAYYDANDAGHTIDVRLADGRIESFHKGAVTVTKAPPPDRTEQLLEQILFELRQPSAVTPVRIVS